MAIIGLSTIATPGSIDSDSPASKKTPDSIMKRRSILRRSPRIEFLEYRQLLAGDVASAVVQLVGNADVASVVGSINAFASDQQGQSNATASAMGHEAHATGHEAPEMSHGVVGDVIETHHDRIPNFAQAPTHVVQESGRWSELESVRDVDSESVVVIAEGHTVVFDMPNVTIKSLGVMGELNFDAEVDTSLTLQELIVFASGSLEIGTPDRPIAEHVRAEIVIGDRSLDPVADPLQYGNGVIVLGKIQTHGQVLDATFAALTTSPQAGDRSLSVSSVPAGWRVGDVIALPQTVVNDSEPLTEQFTITSIGSGLIGLDHPIGHDRSAAIDGDLVTVSKGFAGQELRGHVANLTRNVSIRSENPAGNRGHFMATGHADLDLRYTALEGLGRTTNADLDSTVIEPDGTVSHRGTNQVGRYSLHIHHLYGPMGGLEVDPDVDPVDLDSRQFRLIGNSISDGLKWGIAIHDSHYGQIAGNVVHDVQGAGIITEDGSESFNNFDGNFVLGVEGTGDQSRYDAEGRRGAAFWFRGNHNYITGNVSAASEEGFGFYIQNASGNSQQANLRVGIPLYPGASTHMDGQYRVSPINGLPVLEFSDNEVYAAKQFSLGLWSIQQLPVELEPVFTNTVIWNSTGTAVFLDYSSATFDGLIVRGHASSPTHAAVRGHNANGRSGPLTVQRFDIQQVMHGFIEDSRTVSEAVFEDGYARNYGGFRISNGQEGTYNRRYIFRDVHFDPVAGGALRTIEPFYSDRWTRGGWGVDDVSHDIQILVYDYQGVAGENFRVLFNQQSPDFVIDRRAIGNTHNASVDFQLDGKRIQTRQGYQRVIGSDEPITVAQAWERHRSVLLNRVAWDADTVTHPEIPGLTEELAGETYPEFATLPPVPAFWFAENRTSALDSSVELVYKSPAEAGADAIYFRVDDGPWMIETDNDGRFELSGLASGKHQIQSAYGNSAGDLWGVQVSHSITVRQNASLSSIPLILSPAASGPAGIVNFAWTAVAKATGYELIIEDALGSTVYHDQTSANELLVPITLDVGTYRAQVRVINNDPATTLHLPWVVFKLKVPQPVTSSTLLLANAGTAK